MTPSLTTCSSTLVAFYENGWIGAGFHDDSEEDIDQSYPMKNVNLAEGVSTRDIVIGLRKQPG